jgi:Flp pilus assembly protein TadG
VREIPISLIGATMSTQNSRQRRKGAVVVLAAVMMLLMFAFLAFAVDLGYLSMVRTQLQRAADAAAIAGAGRLLDGEIAANSIYSSTAVNQALSTARDFAGRNKVLNAQPALAESDVVVGYLSNPTNPNEALNVSGVPGYNAVQVRVRRTTEQNGAVPLFFARVLGIDQEGSQARATAAFLNRIGGLQAPSDGTALELLPLALKEESWDQLMAGQGTDKFSYDPSSGNVSHGSDQVKEVNLYPQSTSSPGNSGTIDIGDPNNSTSDISRQIRDGINARDLSFLPGGKLTVPSDLNGDTGMSVGIKDDLKSMIGKPRMIPLYSTVVNPGNNAQFTIVRFVGVVILDVKLNASNQIAHVTVQPAIVRTKGAIPSTTGTSSPYVFSKNVWLVR